MVSSHYFNDRIDPYMHLVSVLCIPVSSIPTSLSFLKVFVLVIVKWTKNQSATLIVLSLHHGYSD